MALVSFMLSTNEGAMRIFRLEIWILVLEDKSRSYKDERLRDLGLVREGGQ